jgi:Flp pilus assembly protein TadD
MVRYHLGMTYISAGQLVKASEQLQKAMELSSNDAELRGKAQAALKSIERS